MTPAFRPTQRKRRMCSKTGQTPKKATARGHLSVPLSFFFLFNQCGGEDTLLRQTLDRWVTEVKGKTYLDFTFALIGRLRLVSYSITIASLKNPLKSKIFWKKKNSLHSTFWLMAPSFELRAPSSAMRTTSLLDDQPLTRVRLL